MAEEQWDVLIYHSSEAHADALAAKLKNIIKSLEPSIGEEVKVDSVAEHFNTNVVFDSIENALTRCSWMFIVITDDLLRDRMNSFLNSQMLCSSILDMGAKKYVPIYENREKMKSESVPSYIKVLHGIILDELDTREVVRNGLKNSVKSKLIERKTRERKAEDKRKVQIVAEYFQNEISNIKHKYETKKAQLQGAAEVENLRSDCATQIQQIARERDIPDVEAFLRAHQIDVSFITAGTAKSLMMYTEQHSYRQPTGSGKLHNVDVGFPSGVREAIEHDEATQNDELEVLNNRSAPPPYRPNYSNASTASVQDSPHRMEELKSPPGMPPPDQRPEVIGRASPLVIPPCDDPLLPTVLDALQSTARGEDTFSLTSFSAVPRHLNTTPYDPEGSMIAECSDTSRSTSLLGSQSHTNLTEFDEEEMSQISRCESVPSSGDEADMDTGDNQVDLSLLLTATGQRPLPLYPDGDDESMVVEVDSTAGGDATFDDTPTATPFRQPASPLRVMHRSHNADDDDLDDMVTMDMGEDGGGDGGSPSSPGFDVGLNLHTWPRQRRGSDAGRRRPYNSNLLSNRFLSLSSVQSLSSKLSRLYNNPSMNNINELSERPRLLDGIRHRYGW